MTGSARRVSRNTAALFLGSIFRLAFSFVFVIAAARLLGVSGFGEYELAVHYGELFVGLIATGLSILITREIAKDNTHVNQLLTAAVTMLLALTAIGIAVLQVLPMALNYAPQTRQSIALAAVVLLPGSFCMLLEASFVAFESATFVTKGTALEGIIRVACGLTALAWGYGVLSLVIILILSRCCLLVYYLCALKQRVPELSWAFEWSTLKRLVYQWKTFALENWLSSISNSLGVIVLSTVHGEYETGLFFAARKLLRLGAVAAQSYTTAVFPHMSRLYTESQQSLQRLGTLSLKFMLASVLPVIVTICIVADHIILLLYSTDYAGATPILRVAAWGIVLQFLNPFLSHVLFARGEQARSMQVAGIRLISQLALALLLIPPWAGVGAAWAAVGASLCALVAYLLFVFRREETAAALLMLGWTTVPALLLAAFLVVGRNIQLMPLLCAGLVFYIFLLFALRVVSPHDLQALQKLR